MKRILLAISTLVIAHFSVSTASAQAYITIDNSMQRDSIMAKLYLPIDGIPYPFYDVENKTITIFGADNNKRITIPSNKPLHIKLDISGSFSIPLFIEQKDDLKIMVNQINGKPSLIFQGSNAAGYSLREEELFKIYDWDDKDRKENPPATTTINQVKAIDKDIKAKFARLRAEGKISEAFEKHAIASLQLNLVTGVFQRAQAKLKNPATYDSTYYLINTLNSYINIFEPQYGFEIFPLMVKSTYLNNGALKDSSRKVNFWDISTVSRHYNYIPMERQSNILGQIIYGELRNRYSENNVDSLYKRLKTNFPESEYIPIIDKFIAKTKEQRKVNLPNSSTIKYANEILEIKDSLSVKPIKELLASTFKGKPVYIDIWALWCGGCLNQIRNTPSTFHRKLASMGVQMLYIFIDNPSTKNRWADYIQQYKMDGYHIHVDKDWMKDFQQAMGITIKGIPRFILIGRNGKVLLDDCEGPVSSEDLYEKVGKALINQK